MLHGNVSRTVRWKLCKRWTIFISPSIHRDTRLVQLFTYLLSNDLSRKSASNSIRLFSVFRSTHPICLRTETLQGLVSTMCRLQAANDHCVRSGEPWGVHSMCQVLWTYEHSLVLPGSKTFLLRALPIILLDIYCNWSMKLIKKGNYAVLLWCDFIF